MPLAKDGDKVKVHYTGKLSDGKVFDSSLEREPIEFKIGKSQVIPGFETAVIGMSEGEDKTVVIEADDAYGPHLNELITDVDKAQFPKDIQPEVGQQLEVQSDEGFQAIVTVSKVDEDMVTLDANHPLAGMDLTFDIKLLEINEN